jgi:hypothetical protein
LNPTQRPGLIPATEQGSGLMPTTPSGLMGVTQEGSGLMETTDSVVMSFMLICGLVAAFI